MRFFKSELHIDFMGAKKWALLGSFIIIGIGIASLIVKGGFRYGVDFAGGTIVQVKFNKSMDTDKLRDSLNVLGLGEILIQRFGPKDENEFLLRLTQTTSSVEGFENNISEILEKDFSSDSFEIRRVEMVGPKVGADLRKKGFWAIIFATIGVLIYVWWRFEFVYSLGAILALVHDVFVTLGAFSLTNREITLPVIAALLTIIGYSLNDTIVIYDRVRDNLKLLRHQPLEKILNTSINQTLSRTILTSLTTFFVVLSLYVLGGEVINDFAFALMIGVVVGTYSSVYIASPVAMFFHKFSPAAKPQPKAVGTKNDLVKAKAKVGLVSGKGGVSRMMAQQKQNEKLVSTGKKGNKKSSSARKRKKSKRS